MSISNRMCAKNLISLLFILAPFALASIWGMGMSMKAGDGQMSGCPFMAGQVAMCQMGIAEHFVKWQRAFLGVPAEMHLLALAMALLAAAAVHLNGLVSELGDRIGAAARLRMRRTARTVHARDPLRRAFSTGILHSRAYEPPRL